MFKKIFLASTLVVALHSTTAAALVVYDPSVHYQTTFASIKATAMEIKTIKANINRLKQLAENLKSNKGMAIADLAQLAGVENSVTRGMDVLRAAQDVNNALRGQGNTLEKVMSVWGASSRSWTSMSAMIADQAKYKKATAKALDDESTAALNAVNSAIAKRREILAKSGAVEGSTAAVQAATAMLENIAQINEASLRQNSLIAKQSAAKEAGEAAAIDAARIKQDAFEASMRARAQRSGEWAGV